MKIAKFFVSGADLDARQSAAKTALEAMGYDVQLIKMCKADKFPERIEVVSHERPSKVERDLNAAIAAGAAAEAREQGVKL